MTTCWRCRQQPDGDGAWAGEDYGTEGISPTAPISAGLYLTAFLAATERLEDDPADAPAMTLIGELYRDGLGLPRDLERAREWYALAAGLGDPHAEFALGEIALGEISLEDATSDTGTAARRSIARRCARAFPARGRGRPSPLRLQSRPDRSSQKTRPQQTGRSCAGSARRSMRDIPAAQYELAGDLS